MGDTFVLGLDLGLATCGVAVIDLGIWTGHVYEHDRVVTFDVITTEASAKKRNVRATADNVRRIRELHDGLLKHVSRRLPVLICAEEQSWPRNSSTCAKIGMAWGVMVSLATMYKIPLLQVSPKQIKEAVCGQASASKEDVRRALEERYANLPPWPTKKSTIEHAADALGAFVACLEDDMLRMARGSVSGQKIMTMRPLRADNEERECPESKRD
jgi:crossover junction endodeoxyribonuclease RuvC